MSAYDIKIEQGSTYLQTVNIVDMLPNGTEVVRDLTDYTVRCQFRPNYTSATVLYDMSVTGAISISSPQEGIIEINIPSSDTQEFKFTTAKYDIEIDLNGVVTRIIEGNVKVYPNVTR